MEIEMDTAYRVFACSVCGHEEKIIWFRVPVAEDGFLAHGMERECPGCNGVSVFIDTGRRTSINGDCDIIILRPKLLNASPEQ